MSRLAERPASIRVSYRGSDGVPVDTTLDQVAVADLAAGLPVREFRSYKGCRHYSGWYWSATMGQLVAYESRLELARIILADFDPRVLAIAAQPFRRVGPDGSRIRRHVPALLLVDVDGAVTVVDVKSPHKRTEGSVQALMAWTDRIVALRGWALEAWYEAPHCLLTNVSGGALVAVG